MKTIDEIANALYDCVQNPCFGTDECYESFFKTLFKEEKKFFSSDIEMSIKENIKNYKFSRKNLEQHSDSIQKVLQSTVNSLPTEIDFTNGFTCDMMKRNDAFSKLAVKMGRKV
jgi:ketopantoate reductase